MIQSFTAENFKSIRHIDLGMRPFMVLVGPNGAGKTNIVRALELFGEIIQRGTLDPVGEEGYEEIIRWGEKPARAGLRFKVELNLPSSVVARSLGLAQRAHPTESLPQNVRIRASIDIRGSVAAEGVSVAQEELDLVSDKGVLTIKARGPSVTIDQGDDESLMRMLQRGFVHVPLRTTEKPTEPTQQVFEQLLGSQPDVEKGLLRVVNWLRLSTPWMRYFRDAMKVARVRLDASSLRADSRFEESTFKRLIGPSGEGLATAVAKLRGTDDVPKPSFRPVLEALQGVYPRIEDVRPERIEARRLTLRFRERGISRSLGQSDVSDRVLHSLALLVSLVGGVGGPGVLVIEEPENAIHPWSVRSMIERAQMYPSRQILLTTHSETVVSAVKDPASLFVVENTDNGTQVTPATEREAALASILKESGQKLGQVWMDGSLGGVPGNQP